MIFYNSIKSIDKKYRPKWANLKETHGTYYEYDFLIELINGVKIIIEIDGPQHNIQVSNWAPPLHNQIRDKIKEKLAIEQKINLIRLNQEHVYQDKQNWKEINNNFIWRKYECNDTIEIYDCVKK